MHVGLSGLSVRENCPYSEFSGPYFPLFGLNTERYEHFIGKRKAPNTDTFHAVSCCMLAVLSDFMRLYVSQKDVICGPSIPMLKSSKINFFS